MKTCSIPYEEPVENPKFRARLLRYKTAVLGISFTLKPEPTLTVPPDGTLIPSNVIERVFWPSPRSTNHPLLPYAYANTKERARSIRVWPGETRCRILQDDSLNAKAFEGEKVICGYVSESEKALRGHLEEAHLGALRGRKACARYLTLLPAIGPATVAIALECIVALLTVREEEEEVVVALEERGRRGELRLGSGADETRVTIISSEESEDKLSRGEPLLITASKGKQKETPAHHVQTTIPHSITKRALKTVDSEDDLSAPARRQSKRYKTEATKRADPTIFSDSTKNQLPLEAAREHAKARHNHTFEVAVGVAKAGKKQKQGGSHRRVGDQKSAGDDYRASSMFTVAIRVVDGVIVDSDDDAL